MDELKLVGNIDNLNVTVVGSFLNSKLRLISYLKSLGYYELNKNNLVIKDVAEEEIKAKLNLVFQGHKKIIFNEVLTFVDTNVRNGLFKYLEEQGVKYVNFTNDMEDTLQAEYLVVLYDNKVALEGKTLDVLKEERLLSRMGINLPFIIDLSIQLQYYGLVDKIYLNKEELVDKLWN